MARQVISTPTRQTVNLETLALTALVLAAVPCGFFLLNLLAYRRLPSPSSSSVLSTGTGPQADKESQLASYRAPRSPNNGRKLGGYAASELPNISVLIPARNEEANLRGVLEAVLTNHGVNFEVVVLDDHSTDRTVEIVREFAVKDSRVRLEFAPTLPAGWCGKQHACLVLAQRARNPLLAFMDADVRLAPDALVRMAEFLQTSDIALASGVPRQELGTISEHLLIPLIHFVLLGYLPMFLMRRTKHAAFSAGCGQLFIARAVAYRATGGHAQIHTTLHDGLKLPRLFRRSGFRTDLFDATDIASCRMYRTNGETWRGLGRNATEGLAAPGTILPMTALLLGGQVLPFGLACLLPWMTERALTLTWIAMALAYLPRILSISRFQQPIFAALLHPMGVAALLLVQWFAFFRRFAGKPSVWKGRSYQSGVVVEAVEAT